VAVQTARQGGLLERVDIVSTYEREGATKARALAALKLPGVIALRPYVAPSE